jgi:ABC-2 type transport system ATP-binding protein
VPEAPAPGLRPDDAPLLDIRGARLRHGGRERLAGASLSLRAGEMVALLGPNGAGKTTLLRAVAGRTPLDAGRILVAGAPPGSHAARRVLGLVPQAIALYPQLGVRANLEIFGRLAGARGAALARAVDEALEWTGLAGRQHEALRSLSGGMQRRVNIAAGTLHAPRLLLLDEPAVGLDPLARREVHDALLRLRGRAIAMLLTTHDLAEAETLADRVAVMKDGQVVRSGTVAGLVAETFGERRELSIRLLADPEPAAAQALAAGGLAATASPRAWIGAVADDLHELAALRARLQQAGVPIESFEVRAAGLHGVFLRLTGREPGA